MQQQVGRVRFARYPSETSTEHGARGRCEGPATCRRPRDGPAIQRPRRTTTTGTFPWRSQGSTPSPARRRAAYAPDRACPASRRRTTVGSRSDPEAPLREGRSGNRCDAGQGLRRRGSHSRRGARGAPIRRLRPATPCPYPGSAASSCRSSKRRLRPSPGSRARPHARSSDVARE